MTLRSDGGALADRSAPQRTWGRAGPGRSSRGRVPLSALRATLDEGSAAANWILNVDGVIGRGLVVSAGATVTVPLTVANAVSFSARAMLLPHDWRDRRGTVRAAVAITDADGERRALWSRALRASDRGRPRGIHVACSIPPGSGVLQLSVHGGTPQHEGVARAIWVEPAIIDPLAPSLPPSETTGPPARMPRPKTRQASNFGADSRA
jgi:hypothetical protein